MNETSKNPKEIEQTQTQVGPEDENSDAAHPVDRESVPLEKGGYEDTIEPTRYGDWEIGGRCVDF